MRRLILVIACGAFIALPAHAQQPGKDTNVIERIDGAVRDFFNRIFGGQENNPAQASPVPVPIPVPEPKLEPEPVPVDEVKTKKTTKKK